MNSISFVAYFVDYLNRMYFAGPKDTEKKVSAFIKDNGLNRGKFVTELYNIMKINEKQAKIEFVIEAADNDFVVKSHKVLENG